MSRMIRSRITLIWMLLVAATAASWAVGHGLGLHAARDAGIAVIVVAFVKVRLVILDFMEIRHAPLTMRIAGESWVAAICTVLILLYLKGGANP